MACVSAGSVPSLVPLLLSLLAMRATEVGPSSEARLPSPCVPAGLEPPCSPRVLPGAVAASPPKCHPASDPDPPPPPPWCIPPSTAQRAVPWFSHLSMSGLSRSGTTPSSSTPNFALVPSPPALGTDPLSSPSPGVLPLPLASVSLPCCCSACSPPPISPASLASPLSQPLPRHFHACLLSLILPQLPPLSPARPTARGLRRPHRVSVLRPRWFSPESAPTSGRDAAGGFNGSLPPCGT